MEVKKVSPTKYEFVFTDSTSTIGNLLQKELLKDSNVIFAGYKKPHPLETRMVITLMTSGKNPREVMNGAFSNLILKLDSLKNFELYEPS